MDPTNHDPSPIPRNLFIKLDLGRVLGSGAKVDQRDFDRAAKCIELLHVRRDLTNKIQIGDYVRFGSTLGRLATFLSNDKAQLSKAASFFITDISVGLSAGSFMFDILDASKCVKTEDVALAEYWFFHHGAPEAYAGVWFEAYAPIYQYTP